MPEHGGDLLPAVSCPQPDLPPRHEAEEQGDGRVLARREPVGATNDHPDFTQELPRKLLPTRAKEPPKPTT